jgi:hypothetical protein
MFISPCHADASVYTLWKKSADIEERKKYASILADEFKRLHGEL